MLEQNSNTSRTQELVKNYLQQGRLMQVASVSGDQPWVCTVYYVSDEQHNLYWLSLPTRRHSQEIAKHAHVAAAIVVKDDQPVIGLQIEGEANIAADARTVSKVMKRYVAIYDSGRDFYDNFMAGTNQHQLYRIKPHLFVLFDELNFHEAPRQEWHL